jgi:hypothetical protein
LDYLQLDRNRLTGTIPTELSSLTNLRVLDLGGNQLSGSIPSQLGSLNSLESLHLDNNQLSGSIPIELSNLSSLEYLYLDRNKLSGNIPVELGNLTPLTELNLASNQLSGSIPPALCNLLNLQILRLNDNQLDGDIPQALNNLTILYNPGMAWDGGDGMDLDYNFLNVPPGYPDPTDPLQVFLHQKDPNWQLYQGFEQVIGAGGGELVSLDGRTDFLIPEGALITDTTFTFIPQPAPHQGHTGLAFAHNSFELTAEDADGIPVITFNLLVTITLTYTDTDIIGIPEGTLGLFYWDEAVSTWADAVTTCLGGEYTRNPDGNTFALPLCHLTEFGVFGVPIRTFVPFIHH